NLHASPEATTADSIQLIVPALGQMTGAGTISASHALNFNMRATVKSTGGVLAMIGQSSGGAATIPFSIQGTSSSPVFRPDVRGLAAANAKSLLGTDGGKKAGGILGGFLD